MTPPVPSSLTVGFLGLGYATTTLHLPAVQALPGARAVGGADSDPARRAAWSALGAGPSFAGLDELLERARPDVVVVATPPADHAQSCIRSLEAGAHVMCEKPFVDDRADADRVLAAARAAGRGLAVNHEFRYMPVFQAVARRVDEEGVGRAVFCSCVQFMDLAPWDEPVPWRAAMPHRSLLEGGVHLLDVLALVAGRQPSYVSAQTSAGLDPTHAADAIHLVTLDYGDGRLAQITIDRLCKAGTRYLDLRVDCEEASLRASFGGRAFVQIGSKRGERPGVRIDFGLQGLAWEERGLRRRVLGRNPRHAARRATGSLWVDAVSAWQRGAEAPTSGAYARDLVAVVEAAYRSAETGQRCEVSGAREATA
jgi:predicted dehydrogenase